MSSQSDEFEAVVAEHERRIYNVVYRVVNDYEAAADLVQETFIRAYRSYDSFRGESQAYTWLYRIAMNLCLDHLARRKKQRAIETPLDVNVPGVGTSPMEVADERNAPDKLIQQQELRTQIENAINALPPLYKDCILLREMEGMSYEQIAQTLEITVEAVRSRVARARAWMRQRLEPYLRA